jgi:hypothetical protein
MRIELFDLAGRRVAVLRDAHEDAGVHRLSWDTSGLRRGMYFYRIRAGGRAVSRSVLILE